MPRLRDARNRPRMEVWDWTKDRRKKLLCRGFGRYPPGMPYDVFISHSTKDKLVADAVVAHLEQNGLRCWCAPRDIMPGTSWASAIVEGIAACKAMVVVFSTNANTSDHIRREVERAV